MPGACIQSKAQAAGGVKEMPDTQEADIHTEEDVTKVRNFSADIMKESLRVRKREALRIS